MRGLMAIVPPVEDPEEARPWFRQMRELRDLAQKKIPGLMEMKLKLKQEKGQLTKVISWLNCIPCQIVLRLLTSSTLLKRIRMLPYAGLNFSLPCLHLGHFQSSGRSAKATPSCSAGS